MSKHVLDDKYGTFKNKNAAFQSGRNITHTTPSVAKQLEDAAQRGYEKS